MLTNRKNVLVLAASLSLATVAQAQQCPPPCTDGECYPRRATWGYYNTNWTAWPGDAEDPVPERERAREIDGVEPNPDIDARSEHLLAPPPTEEAIERQRAEGEAEEGAGAADISMPPIQPFVPPPTGPGARGDDAPPVLPRFNPPPPSGPGADAGFSGKPEPRRPAYTPGEGPPPLPTEFTKMVDHGRVRPVAYYEPVERRSTLDR